jgi:hypothetical protein
VITVPMSAADARGMRFAYSPLTEIAESLYQIASGGFTPSIKAGSQAFVPSYLGWT